MKKMQRIFLFLKHMFLAALLMLKKLFQILTKNNNFFMKVTSGVFHPNIPKSRSDVRMTCRFRPYHSTGVFLIQHMALIRQGRITFISGCHVTLGPYHSGRYSCFTIQNPRSPKCRSVKDTWHSSISSCDST
jgi:hypothetical protein